MFDEPSAGLHQPLLQAGERPLPDRRGQRQPPPEEKRELRHKYYAAKVHQQKGTAIKVRQNQPIRPRPEEREVKR